MATLPADRTKLALAQSNQTAGNVAASTKNINAMTESYDTIDLLNQKVDTHAAAAVLPHADLSVTTAKIALLAVGTAQLANTAITTAKMTDLNVTTAKLADANVTLVKMAANSVGTTQIVDASVTTAKQADLSITTAKLGESSVTLSKMADASVGTTELVDLSVTTNKIARGAITADKLVAGSLNNDTQNALNIVALQADVVQRGVNVMALPAPYVSAIGDGVNDDTAAILSALTLGAGKSIYFPTPSVAYKVTAAISPAANTRLYGENKLTTKILKAFNGTLMDIANGVTLESLYIEGDGANFTGKLIDFTGTNGRQTIRDCRIINGEGASLNFATAAGSQCFVENCETYRHGGTTGTNLFAIVIDATQQLAAIPRKFVGIETSGNCSFDFGGGNGTVVMASFVGDLKFTTDSRGTKFTGNRLLNQLALTIDGKNGTITGNDISAQLTIAAGANTNIISDNCYNIMPIIDNSGSRTNVITHPTTDYTPVLTSGGTAPVLGNGSLIGEYARNGSVMTVTINFMLGSTTTLGTGALSFSLPYARFTGDIAECGTVAINISGTFFLAFAQIAGAVGTFQPICPSTGSVTFNSPDVFVTGNTIRMTITYSL